MHFTQKPANYAKLCHSNFRISVRYNLQRIVLLSLLRNMQMQRVPNPNHNCVVMIYSTPIVARDIIIVIRISNNNLHGIQLQTIM
jgi:hypothetical protein